MICAVILSGGVGARLWPMSRKNYPKPFIQMPDGLSLLQHTYLRLLNAPCVNEIVHVTNESLIYAVKDQLQEINVKNPRNITPFYILEPFAKNTAAAIALATLQAKILLGEETLLLVLPSDHLILDQEKFNQALIQAMHLAIQGNIITFGIKAHTPETGYGYIEVQDNQVKRFVEKPCLNDAKKYVASGNYFWNSGMFCYKAQTLIDEMQLLAPDILFSAQQCLKTSKTVRSQLQIDPIGFKALREESIDYAVMEKSTKISFIPCDFQWHDIGTWQAISQLSSSDDMGNVIKGETVLEDVKNCYIESQNKMIGAVGIEDLLIIDTPDALLIAHKEHAQNVKLIYNQLKDKLHKTHESHTTIQRPWGTYTILEENDYCKVKRIEINPGGKLSLQMHKHRAEHWVIVAGNAHLINGEHESTIGVGEYTYVPLGNLHRISNPSKNEMLIIIEIQVGSYLSEDDIIRVHDVYERVVLHEEA